MIIFKKMFAEKILRFHEAMNRFSELLMRMPHLGDKIRNQIEENDNYRLKMTFGVIAQIGIVLFELLRKFFICRIFCVSAIQNYSTFLSAHCITQRADNDIFVFYAFNNMWKSGKYHAYVDG